MDPNESREPMGLEDGTDVGAGWAGAPCWVPVTVGTSVGGLGSDDPGVEGGVSDSPVSPVSPGAEGSVGSVGSVGPVGSGEVDGGVVGEVSPGAVG